MKRKDEASPGGPITPVTPFLRSWRLRWAEGVIACISVLALAAPGYGQSDSVNQNIALLRSASPADRTAAAWRLGDSQDASAVAPLIVALKDDDFHVRAYAAASLGQIKDATAVEPLIATLKDTNASVRQMSTYALGQIADPRAVDALIIALKDNDCNVRASAAIALGEVGDSRAVSPLIAALQDRDAEARSDAAVSRFNRIALGTIIANAELSNTQSPASVALTRIGAPAISPLVAALRDGNPDLRAGAAVTLGYIKDARAVEPLIEALKGSDADLARRAAVALGTIGTAAAAAVNAALKDPDPNLRHRVATALSQAGVIIFLELAYSRVGSSPTFSGGFSPSLIVIAFPFFGQLIQFV